MPSFLIAREGGVNSPGYRSLVKQYSTWFGMPHMSALHDLIGAAQRHLMRSVPFTLNFVAAAFTSAAAALG